MAGLLKGTRFVMASAVQAAAGNRVNMKSAMPKLSKGPSARAIGMPLFFELSRTPRRATTRPASGSVITL